MLTGEAWRGLVGADRASSLDSLMVVSGEDWSGLVGSGRLQKRSGQGWGLDPLVLASGEAWGGLFGAGGVWTPLWSFHWRPGED